MQLSRWMKHAIINMPLYDTDHLMIGSMHVACKNLQIITNESIEAYNKQLRTYIS